MTRHEITTRDGLAAAGIGLRSVHMAEIMETRPAIGFLEVHAENYMTGAPAVGALERLRRNYPISIHGVGLSLGSAGPLDRGHLARFRALIDRIDPDLVSEHLSWSGLPGTYLNDLLPLPYMEESLEVVSAHIDEAQTALGRRLLIENPAAYLRFRHSTIPEAEFLAELVRRTGCGILCDINNLYVNADNFGFDPWAYLAALPARAIGEIHLAGYHRADVDGRSILIDDHGSTVAKPVWDLYAHALDRFGPRPTLIEWDSRLPTLAVLLGEARFADRIGAMTMAERRTRALA
jgi:uncharacterized protein (UPF0276 family)